MWLRKNLQFRGTSEERGQLSNLRSRWKSKRLKTRTPEKSDRAHTELVSSSGFQLAETAYWQSTEVAVAAEIEFPRNQFGLQKTQKVIRFLSSYFIDAIRIKAVEVSERRLNQEQEAQSQVAKTIDRNFIAAIAFETLPERLRPSKEQIIHIR
eukprot:s2597_g14.t1